MAKTHATQDRPSSEDRCPTPATSTKLAGTWLVSYQTRPHSSTKAVIPKTKKPKVKAEKVHTSWSQGVGAGEGSGATRARGALRMNPRGLRRGLPENKTVSPRPEAMGKLLGWARKGRRQRTLCIPPSTSFFPLSSEPARNGSLQASLKAHLPLACCLSWGGRPPRPSAVPAGQASCLQPAKAMFPAPALGRE